MKLIRTVLLVCFALSLAEAQSGNDAAARSNILALEHAWDQALEREDVKALSAIFDNSLLIIDYDGKLLTKPEYLARVKLNTARLHEVVASDMSVELFGNVAIVVGVYRASGLEDGRPVIRRGRFSDTWVIEGSNWICIAAIATPILR
jgi:ketosteroid isomerase-like protein